MQMMHDAASKWHWRRSVAPHTVRDHASFPAPPRLPHALTHAPTRPVRPRRDLASGARSPPCVTVPRRRPSPRPTPPRRRSQAEDAGPHPVLDRIRSTGRIVLAHRESSVPFSYFDANKKPVGYALDLCKDVAEAVRKHLGLKSIEIAYLPITTATRIDAIASGKADLECGATTNNAERRKKVAFTIPHYITGSRYAVRADSTIEELAQFEGHVLVSTAGSTPFKAIDTANRRPPAAHRRAPGQGQRRGDEDARRPDAPTASRWTTCSCTA